MKGGIVKGGVVKGGAMKGLVLGFLAMLLAGTAVAQTSGAAGVVAPTGTLRAAINFGNPVLAQRGPDGKPGGVSVALATELARRLHVPLSLVPFNSAGGVTSALKDGGYDICFLAIDPVRGEELDFTAPYVLIEGGYAVRRDAPFPTVESVDAAGVRVLVATGSAYDLFLTRALTHAALQRFPTGNDAAAAFVRGEGDVLAGVKQPLEQLVGSNPALRMVPGRFMAIEQAMATPKGRDPAGLAEMQAFLVEMKVSGLVAKALADSGQRDAKVAP